MSLRLDPKRIAKLTFDKISKKDKDDDFLAEDGPEFDAPEYEQTTGLRDGESLGEMEGTGDRRKRLLMKALANIK